MDAHGSEGGAIRVVLLGLRRSGPRACFTLQKREILLCLLADLMFRISWSSSDAMTRRGSGTNWSWLRWLIEFNLRQRPGFQKDFRLDGRIETLGQGLFHRNYLRSTSAKRVGGFKDQSDSGG
jgi:hypothetical protein